MNPSKTYFHRIKKFIIFMAIISQMFAFFTVTISYIKYKISNVQNLAEIQKNHYSSQMDSLFMKIDNMLLQFDNSYASELCSSNIMKMSETELNEKYKSVCEQLSVAPLTNRYFKGYWLIGSNSNYLAFSNINGEFSDSSDYRFDYSYLFNTHAPNNFNKNYQKIFIFNEENIPDVYIPASEMKYYSSLYDSLIGKPVYFTFHRGNLCIFIFNEDFFVRTFASNGISNTSIVLENSSGEVIYSRFTGTDAKKFRNNLFDGEKITKDNLYTLRIKHHIKITMTDIIFLLLVSVLSVLMILNSLRLARKHSNEIMEPYIILNNFFRLSNKESEINEFDYSQFSASVNKRSEISANCLFAVLSTMVIPIIVTLIIFSVLLNFCTQHIIDSYMTTVHYQIEEEVYNNIDFFITNAQYNIKDENENSRLNYTVVLDENFKLKSIPFESLQHLSFSDFNRQLKSESFNLKKRKLINISSDFFEDQALALVHPQKDGTYKLNVIKSTVVESSPMYSFVNSMLTDHNQNTITQSIVIDDNYKEKVIRKDSDIVVHQSQLSEFGWTLSTFNDKNLVKKDLYAVIWFDIIIISSFLILMIFISWYCSIFFVRPLERIMSLMTENDMNRNAEKVQTGNNEIDEMFYLYNRMINHIKEMTDEKILFLKQAEELKARKHRAELIALQKQINPHFVFNTLEIISLNAMTRGDYDTSKIVSKLSTLFRYSMSRKNEAKTLYDEICNVKNYLDVWDMRFPGRYKFVFDIAPSAKIILMPKLILQPIVENCMMHAFDQITRNCVIKIATQTSDDYIKIIISDNGCGISQENLQKLTREIKEKNILDVGDTGIGLINVYQRLLIFYGNSADMIVESTPSVGTTITLKFIPKYS